MGDLALVALTTAAGLAKAGGEAAATDQKAADAAVAARRGKIAAAETDTVLRQNLADIISNIRTVRASASIDPNSPTTAAILANETDKAERDRRIRVANIEAQVDSDENASAFYRNSANNQWLYGSLAAIGGGYEKFRQYA